MRKNARLVYLGPKGSFSYQAALALCPDHVELEACSSLEDVIDLVVSGQRSYGIAAETSSAGPIQLTHELVASDRVSVLNRTNIAVSFDLYRPSDDSSELIGLLGHEMALKQVQPWIQTRSLKTQCVASNTLGLDIVAKGHKGWGAIGPSGLAQVFGLEVIEQALEYPARNTTRFVLFTRSP